MKKTAIFFFSFLVVLFISPFQTIASTNVTGNITQNTTWNIAGSPYNIMNDIQVYENITLIIQPGVEVVFQGTASMEIGGQFIARGTAVSPINFSSNNVWDRRQSDKIGGVSFLETAPSASYKPGFIHDYQNNQLLLEYDNTQGYDSGSIFDYCLFDNFDIAIKSSNSLPCVMNSAIRNSYYGLFVEYDPELPQYKWFFIYNNTIESCEIAILVGQYPAGDVRRGIALISGNIIKNCGFIGTSSSYGAIVDINGDRSGIFLFNNQIINSAGLGFGNFQTYDTNYDYWPSDAGAGPVVFMEHNSITHNYAGVAVNGWNALFHNYIEQNQTDNRWADRVLGAGVFLTGPVGMVFNNSIQLNGVNGVTSQDSYGDGIALSSSGNNTFVINHNNLGNSVWDMQDIYLYADGDDCATSKLMNVDARYNAWNVSADDIPFHIFDQNDDMCAGTVDYLPIQQDLPIIPPPLDTHLQSPVDNTYLPDTKTVDFSWSAVAGATKYMLGIFGKDTHYGFYSLNKLEVVNTTSVTIDFSSSMAFDYGMKVVHWFVVAGNDIGWSLPSAIRKLTFSPDPILVTGKVRNENKISLSGVYVGYIPSGDRIVHSFTDESGNYTLIPEDVHGEIAPDHYLIKKRGYVPCYTYPRGQREFDIAPDLMIVSPQRRDFLYTAAGITRDTTKGEISGVIINENNEALSGAEISIEPSSGVIYYLDGNGNPDSHLTATGTLGEFIIFNVTPGEYKINASVNGATYDTAISVYQGSITLDSLITAGGGGGNSSITGKLVDESGQPLGNVKIECAGVDMSSQAMSDPVDGTFTVYGLGAGPGQIRILSDPGRYLAGFRRMYYLETGENKDIKTLTVQKGAIISGMVARGGIPMQGYSLTVGAKLILDKMDARADGTFSFVLPPGDFTINSEDAMDSFTTVPYKVVVEQTDLMTTKSIPAIAVFDLSNGDVYNGMVTMNSSPPTGTGVMVVAFMNDETFELNNWGTMNPLSVAGIFDGSMTPNPYEIATPQGSTVSLTLGLYSEGNDENESFTMIDSIRNIIGGGTYNYTYNTSGSVVDGYVTQNDEPVFFALIGLYRKIDNEFIGFAKTDHTGHYALYDIPDGTYWIEATAEDYVGKIKTSDFFVNDNITIPTIQFVSIEDSDGDGVPDDQDLCPDTQANVAIDSNGCAIKGDINSDGNIDLEDSRLGLKVLTSYENAADVSEEVNGDGKIGLKDTIYIIQRSQENNGD